ncbi:hypothetical protein UVI_02021210 [Ustilaginoidea virens]|uniref:Dihydrolipoyl dehydrogenase n=1 Tax=Ustilaginoidea virens TaxID=1159556 RepID=A0A1B5KYS3_USTVR|nr:hypothetical protein UVI_02021210 [Ustilaginoidea virens]
MLRRYSKQYVEETGREDIIPTASRPAQKSSSSHKAKSALNDSHAEIGGRAVHDQDDTDDSDSPDDASGDESIEQYEDDEHYEESTDEPGTPNVLRTQLAQDDAEIAELERKLGIKKGRRSLPQAFKDDGLDELLEQVQQNESSSEDEMKKRKSAYDDWLSSKRRKVDSANEIAVDYRQPSEDVAESTNRQRPNGHVVDSVALDLSESEAVENDFGHAVDECGSDTETPKSTQFLQRENPYVAPKVHNANLKYVPPSKRHGDDIQRSQASGLLQKKIQGLINRLTDANLLSIVQSVEKIYQSHARADVTETLVDVILAQMRKSESLPDQFFVLTGGFSAAIYKIMGSSFGSHLVREVVKEFTQQYQLASNEADGSAVIKKEPANFLTFLTQMYVFEILGCGIIFDYMEKLLDRLSELNVELLLRICRMAGRLMRRDDPKALKHVSHILATSVSKMDRANISARTKFMVETIHGLSSTKAKTKGADSTTVSEHVIRMKKNLGELKSQSRRLDGLAPMGIRLKDVEDVERHGKWWLVGASVPEYRDAAERAKMKSKAVTAGDDAVPDDDEDMDFVLPDYPKKARAQGLTSSVQIAIFSALMSAMDYEHGYRQFLDLNLKRDDQLEVTRVLLQCVGSELDYNDYYALVGKQACTNSRIRFSFQDRLWRIFRGLGESLFGEGEDDESTLEGERMKNERRLSHVARFYASLVAEGALSINLLKPVELAKMNQWTCLFVETLLLGLLRKCRREKRQQDATMERIFGPSRDLPTLAASLHWFLRKKLSKTKLTTDKERKGIQRDPNPGPQVACIEKRGTLGGTCLNVGCIPSKSLLNNSHLYHQILHDTKNRGIEVGDVKLNLANFMKAKETAVNGLTKGVEFLLKKNGVEYIKGAGSFINENDIKVALNDGGETTVRGKNILIATGSEATPFPGLEVDEKRVVTSTGAIALEKIPETMIVIGGGIIGLEMASVWSRLGTKVTVVEFLGQIGGPGMDTEIAKATQKLLKKQGMDFKLNTKVVGGDKSGDKVKLDVDAAKGGKPETLDAEVVLVAIGRRPYTQGLGLENIGMELDDRGRVIIDSEYRTKIPHIRCVGDVTFGPMLAHKAEEEAVAVVEYIKKGYGHVNYGCIPSVMYTYPEVAWVGQNEQELKDQKIPYRVGTFPFSANSRAKTNLDTDGLVKMLADPETDRLLGVHIIGPNAGEMIAEGTLALEYGASTEDIARTCHAHPTLAEAFKEAAMATSSKAIHF